MWQPWRETIQGYTVSKHPMERCAVSWTGIHFDKRALPLEKQGDVGRGGGRHRLRSRLQVIDGRVDSAALYSHLSLQRTSL